MIRIPRLPFTLPAWFDRDPDRVAYRRSALRVAAKVALISALLVLSIILLVVAYVIWQLTPAQEQEPHGPEDLHIYLDAYDVLIAFAGIGGFSILLAGVATWVIASRAVRPIGEALRIQRTFVADASHELRTPLAVLNTRVQLFRNEFDDDDPRLETVNELHEDARALIDIVNDLLEAAAGARPSGEAAATPLDREIGSTIDDLTVLADRHEVKLQAEPTDLVVALPAVPLRRCILALVDNAISHSPNGATVTVSATQRGAMARIIVRDEGTGIVGIPPRRVFERFAHGSGTPVQQEHRTGFGIGLALVKEIAIRFGGDVSVLHTGPDGSAFLLELPLDQQQDPGGR